MNDIHTMNDARSDWQNLHRRIMDFKTRKNLSIVRFIKLCGLDGDNVKLQKYCCSKGNQLHPRYREGNPGKKFIDKVRDFLNSEASENYVNLNPERSTREIIREIMNEDYPRLRELGLFGGFIYDDEKDTIIIECPTNDEYKDTLNREGIVSYIRERVSTNSEIIFEDVELLMMTSPLVANNCQCGGYGTMSVVFVDESMVVAVTCLHVVRDESSDTVYASHNPSSADQPFGKVCVRIDEDDVALIKVHPRQHHTVNSVHFNNTSYDLHFGRFNSSINFLRSYLMDRTVYKIGVTTGMTEGKVVHVDENRMMVQDVHGGVFAKPGDSGSLVFMKCNEHYNLVVGMASRVNNDRYCWVVGVWRFYDDLFVGTTSYL